MQDVASVGFVGAGGLGGPMVEQLMAAGVEVHLFVRRPERAAHFADRGAIIAESVAAVARAAPVLVMCPFSEAQVAEILDGSGGVLANASAGCTIVQHGTVSRDGITAWAGHAAAVGVGLVDAPVDGSPDDVRAGTLTVLLGGEPESVAIAEQVVGSYGSPVLHTGGIGTATTAKLINNLVFAAQSQIVCAATNAGRGLGLDPVLLLDVLGASAASSGSGTMLRAMGGDVGMFSDVVGPFMRKDLPLALQILRESGADAGVIAAAAENGPCDFGGLSTAGA